MLSLVSDNRRTKALPLDELEAVSWQTWTATGLVYLRGDSLCVAVTFAKVKEQPCVRFRES